MNNLYNENENDFITNKQDIIIKRLLAAATALRESAELIERRVGTLSPDNVDENIGRAVTAVMGNISQGNLSAILVVESAIEELVNIGTVRNCAVERLAKELADKNL